MIPKTIPIDVTTQPEEFGTHPSLTYKFDFTNKRIIGKIDGPESLIQAIKKILYTNKYSALIYDWYYGNEIYRLLGMSYDYVQAEAPRMIEEALLVDDRIHYISDFSFTQNSLDSLSISFYIHTIYGNLPYTWEVPV